MYLSRLILNPRSRQVQRDLSSAYEMHKTLSTAFPDKQKGGYGRILWRVDESADNLYIVFVQSEKKPDWHKLILKPEYGDYLGDFGETNPACREISPDIFRFSSGKMLSFRLRANPTKKIGTSSKEDRIAGKKSNGKRVPLKNVDDQINWLQRKGKLGGFELCHATVTQTDHQKSVTGIKEKGSEYERHKITLVGVRFEGILQVTDTDLFYQTLCNGIGSAKGLGMGLLSIAPAS